MLLQVGADQQLSMLGYVSADVTPANGMVFTTDMSLQA